MKGLPIHGLITRQSRRLGLSETELVSRSGYRNTAKGLRRLRALMSGDFRSTGHLIAALPAALEVPGRDVEKAIKASKDAIAAADQARYAASFVPHAVILTERHIPQPIFPVAMFGADRFLRIDLDTSRHRRTYVAQTLAGLAEKAPEGKVACFGWVIGFVINYSPSRAVRFSPDGQAQALLSAAYRIGHATMKVKGRDLPVATLVDR